MARGLTLGVIAAITAKEVEPVYMVSMGTAGGPIYAWTGYGTIVWNSMSFLGVGIFGGVTVISESSDLTASGIQLQLSGVDPTLITVALEDIQSGQNATVWLGFMNAGALTADPYPIFAGFTDVPEINESADSVSIQVSVESYLSNMGRVLGRRLTTPDQQLIDPTDLGFEYVPGLQNATINFGGS